MRDPIQRFINRRRRNGLPVVLVEYVVGMLGGTWATEDVVLSMDSRTQGDKRVSSHTRQG